MAYAPGQSGNPDRQFAPGKSGNPGGRPKHKAWRDALERAVNRVDEAQKRPRLDLIAEACVKAALEGDAQAYKEIGDRLDGKVPQAQIHMGDEDGGPIEQKITRIELVAASGDSKA